MKWTIRRDRWGWNWKGEMTERRRGGKWKKEKKEVGNMKERRERRKKWKERKKEREDTRGGKEKGRDLTQPQSHRMQGHQGAPTTSQCTLPRHWGTRRIRMWRWVLFCLINNDNDGDDGEEVVVVIV